MLKTAQVIKSTGSFYTVQSDEKIYSCTMKGKFRTKGIRSTSPVAVGDIVDFEIVSTQENTGIITKIHERRNALVRKSINLSKKSHVLAANIDLSVVLAGLKEPHTYSLFIDRVLVAAESDGIKSAIVFNKTDIYSDQDMKQLEYLRQVYEAAGYQVFSISVKQNKGIDAVRELIDNKTIIFAGNSGVGKSSLINLLEPELELKTTEISEQHEQGKHTTTFAEMFTIGNTQVIDTPGIKGFGLVDIDFRFLSKYFPEMDRLRQQCKFNNCTHTHEPNCKIKEAVSFGTLSEERYNNYLKILNEQNGKYREDIYDLD
ncbi:MAG: ribosome small subunit-dependent GTPase A [Bacteroidota bacterium]|nr:ribosome small subunit-dependent GTPase A [Bacteroidota bacterium]